MTKKQIYTKLDEKLVEKIDKMAAEDKRTRSQMIGLIIEEYFEKVRKDV